MPLQKEETDRLRSQTTGLIGAMDCFSEGIMLVNTDSENWNILFVNDAWSRVTGKAESAMRACAGSDFFFASAFVRHKSVSHPGGSCNSAEARPGMGQLPLRPDQKQCEDNVCLRRLHEGGCSRQASVWTL